MYIYVITFIMLIVLSYTDCKTQRIPNTVTFPCMLIGLTMRGFPSLITILFVVMLFLFGAVNILPMGDVKMYMAVGFLLSGGAGFLVLLVSQCILIVYSIIKKGSVYIWQDRVTSYPLAPFVFVSYVILIIAKFML